MNAPDNFTAQQAGDPSTPPQVLADIAALRPDLRPAVAKNPSAYPALLEWLGSLGEAPVDEALRERRAEAAAAPVTPEPSTPAPPYTGPVTTSSTTPQPSGEPFGAPVAGAPGPYGAPAPGPYGAPAPGAGGPSQGGTPPYGGAGYAYGAPPPAKKSNKVLWIVLAVVGALVVLGVIGAVLLGRLIGNAIPDGTYGSDQQLDQLWDACEDEDWQACDDLYFQSPMGSEYEDFGDTCGNRTAGDELCTVEMGMPEEEPQDEPGGGSYGDDAELDALWDACEGEDWQACDDLFFQSPGGSEYEDFGATCGNRTDGSGLCTSVMGEDASGEVDGYGDDPALDALWDACEGGDMAACDSLFMDSPAGSEYEEFADTCGGRQEGGEWCDS